MTHSRDGIMASYFYFHPDLVVPVYWLADEEEPAAPSQTVQT